MSTMAPASASGPVIGPAGSAPPTSPARGGALGGRPYHPWGAPTTPYLPSAALVRDAAASMASVSVATRNPDADAACLLPLPTALRAGRALSRACRRSFVLGGRASRLWAARLFAATRTRWVPLQAAASVAFVALYALGTYAGPATRGSLRDIAETLLATLFAIDYVHRVRASSRPLYKALGPSGLLELASFLPPLAERIIEGTGGAGLWAAQALAAAAATATEGAAAVGGAGAWRIALPGGREGFAAALAAAILEAAAAASAEGAAALAALACGAAAATGVSSRLGWTRVLRGKEKR